MKRKIRLALFGLSDRLCAPLIADEFGAKRRPVRRLGARVLFEAGNVAGEIGWHLRDGAS